MSNHSFRPLSSSEHKLLDRLLSPDFPGRDELVQQLDDCEVREIDDNGSLEFKVETAIRANRVKYRVPTEGECEDMDNVTVHILLHVLDEKLNELEIYKEDNSKVMRPINAEDVRVCAAP